MATAGSVKAKIIGLIDKSNATTGNTDTDLTTAVDALVDGYGKGGSTVETQEKTVDITENGTTEVLPDEGFALSKVTVNTNVASVGGTPKLNAPTLNLALSNLLIEAADNGSFDDGYRLYIDGVQVAELAITTTTVDLTTYISEEGDYTISVVCYGDGFEDSDEVSVAFTYVVRGVSFLGQVATLDIYIDYGTCHSANVDEKIAVFTCGDRSSGKANSCDDEFTISPVTVSSGLYLISTASFENAAIFAGGAYYSAGDYKMSNYVCAYDADMTSAQLDRMGTAMCAMQCAYASHLALFAYGRSSVYEHEGFLDAVEVYDKDLVRHNPVSLSVARAVGKAGSSKSLAIFYGGKSSGGQSQVIDAFDKDLTRSTKEISSSIYTNAKNGAGRIGDYAIFINGYSNNSARVSRFVLDDNLTQMSIKGNDSHETNIVTVGDYAVAPFDSITDVWDIALTNTKIQQTAYSYNPGTTIGDYALYNSANKLRAYQAK